MSPFSKCILIGQALDTFGRVSPSGHRGRGCGEGGGKKPNRLYATPEKFLRLGLSSTLIRNYHRASRKHSSNRQNLTTPPCVLVWTKNILETETFENDNVTIIGFPRRAFLKRKSKLTTADCCVFNFSALFDDDRQMSSGHPTKAPTLQTS